MIYLFTFSTPLSTMDTLIFVLQALMFSLFGDYKKADNCGLYQYVFIDEAARAKLRTAVALSRLNSRFKAEFDSLCADLVGVKGEIPWLYAQGKRLEIKLAHPEGGRSLYTALLEAGLLTNAHPPSTMWLAGNLMDPTPFYVVKAMVQCGHVSQDPQVASQDEFLVSLVPDHDDLMFYLTG
jgi:hypothetical protein